MTRCQDEGLAYTKSGGVRGGRLEHVQLEAVCAYRPVRNVDQVGMVAEHDHPTVGSATARKLAGLGISRAGQLRDMPLKQARAVGTVVLERLVAELRGVPSSAVETMEPQRKGMAVTRSFGSPVTSLDGLTRRASPTSPASARDAIRSNDRPATVPTEGSLPSSQPQLDAIAALSQPLAGNCFTDPG